MIAIKKGTKVYIFRGRRERERKRDRRKKMRSKLG